MSYSGPKGTAQGGLNDAARNAWKGDNGFLDPMSSLLGGTGIPGLTGGDAESSAYADGYQYSSYTNTSPWNIDRSSGGISQISVGIIAAAALLGLLVWKRS